MEFLRSPTGYLEIVKKPLALVILVQIVDFVISTSGIKYYDFWIATVGFLLGLWLPVYIGWTVVKRRGGRIMHGVTAAVLVHAVGAVVGTVLVFFYYFDLDLVLASAILFAISLVFWTVVAAVGAGIAGLVARATGEARWVDGLLIASLIFAVLFSFFAFAMMRGYYDRLILPGEFLLNTTLDSCVEGASVSNDFNWMRDETTVVNRTYYKGREACHLVFRRVIAGRESAVDYYVIDGQTRCSVNDDGDENCENWS